MKEVTKLRDTAQGGRENVRTDYTGFIKPLINDTIATIYNTDRDYINFYNSSDFTNHEKRMLLIKKTYKHIKQEAMAIRLKHSLNDEDPKALVRYAKGLLDTIIVLEQGIYQAMHAEDTSDADNLLNEIGDLYGGMMDYESTELFEVITKCIDESKPF